MKWEGILQLANSKSGTPRSLDPHVEQNLPDARAPQKTHVVVLEE
jgi:hypothetical protein